VVWRFLKLLLWVVPPLLIGSAVAVLIWFKKDVIEREDQLGEDVGELRTAEVEHYDFGLSQFDDAVEFLRDGKVEEARHELMTLLRFHRNSARADDAMMLLGQINLDRLFDPSVPRPGKKRVEVVRGDSLAKIAKTHHSTVQYIVRASGLARPESIQPHEQVVVCPMNFTAVVRLGEKKILLMDGGSYFASFPIRSIRKPPGARLPWKGKVVGKFGMKNGKRALLSDPSVCGEEKWIEMSRDWGIRSVVDDGSPPTGFGIFVAPEHAADLVALLRKGSRVEINP